MPKRIAQGTKKTAQKKAVDPYKAELADRIATALKRFNADAPRGSELSQEAFAAAVSKRMGLGEADAYTQTGVSRWMSITNPTSPAPKTLAAIAAVLKADLMWLTYGDDPFAGGNMGIAEAPGVEEFTGEEEEQKPARRAAGQRKRPR